MRSSKQRSRSKNSRNRSVGNIVNRVFDSSGPEGKVRGTPQQIIDKYNQLARDAQLSGDRVATENFQQHAEHYTRLLAEAMREQEARREAQEQQNRERQQQRQAERSEASAVRDPAEQPQPDALEPSEPDRSTADVVDDPASAPQPDVIEPSASAASDPETSAGTGAGTGDVIDVAATETGLVETPESKPAPKPRTRRSRKKPATDSSSGDAAEAAE